MGGWHTLTLLDDSGWPTSNIFTAKPLVLLKVRMLPAMLSARYKLLNTCFSASPVFSSLYGLLKQNTVGGDPNAPQRYAAPKKMRTSSNAAYSYLATERGFQPWRSPTGSLFWAAASAP